MLVANEAAAGAQGMQSVPGGLYFAPVANAARAAQPVVSFWLDERAVTNAEFLAFVRAHARWRRSNVPRALADEAYLSSWEGDLELGATTHTEQPVTFVSWFAASAYCRSIGKRLPSEAEWELAANPPEPDPLARARARSRILAFYARPRGAVPRAGLTSPNSFGLRDLHGLVWEWVAENGGELGVGSESAAGSEDRFCGGGAEGARDADDYATFMRFAFRESLAPSYALHHLGFRCAKSAP